VKAAEHPPSNRRTSRADGVQRGAGSSFAGASLYPLGTLYPLGALFGALFGNEVRTARLAAVPRAASPAHPSDSGGSRGSAEQHGVRPRDRTHSYVGTIRRRCL